MPDLGPIEDGVCQRLLRERLERRRQLLMMITDAQARAALRGDIDCLEAQLAAAGNKAANA